MYRFDKKLDLSKLAGENLEQICVGKYDIQFKVGRDVSIGLQSRVVLLDDSRVAATWSEEDGWSSTSYHEILNQEVVAASIESKTMMEIKFANQWRLQLFDESDDYESMTIWGLYDDDQVVVV